MKSVQELDSVRTKRPLRPLNYRLGLDVGTNSLGWAVYEVEEDPDKLGVWEPIRLADSGVRIFSDGRNDKKEPLKQARREKRQARRQRARYIQRRNKLRRVLCEHGLFPYCETCKASNKQRFETSTNKVDKYALLQLCGACQDEQRVLQDLDPYELRARGVGAVKEDDAIQLSHFELGRALFHLQQRRGYQSNLVVGSGGYGSALRGVRQILIAMGLLESTSDDEQYRAKYESKTKKFNANASNDTKAHNNVELTKEEKKAVRKKQSEERERASHQYILALEELKQITHLTLGSWLHERKTDAKSVRARNAKEDSAGTKLVYDFYPSRRLVEDEFSKLWDYNRKHLQLSNEAREAVRDAIFHQRPLKVQDVGKCSVYPDEKRTYRATSSFQWYRILQETGDLTWLSPQGEECLLANYPSAWRSLAEELMAKKDMAFKAIRKYLIKNGDLADKIDTNTAFKIEAATGRTRLFGNESFAVFKSIAPLAAKWESWSQVERDDFILALIAPSQDVKAYESETALTAKFKEAPYGFDTATVQDIIECVERLPSSVTNISLKAAREVAEKAITGERPIQEVLRELRGDDHHHDQREKLPYYGEFFADSGGHVVGDSRDEGDEADKGNEALYWGQIPNPTVHISLNQIRRVVNELIEIYGKPRSIAIELAREVAAGKEQRSKITKTINDNTKKNASIDEKLRDAGMIVNRANRDKYRFWEELAENPCDRVCPFSGDPISIELLATDVEIEHLIPYASSLDDSRMNRTICTVAANRRKAKCTPYEAFGQVKGGKYAWGEIEQRVKNSRMPYDKKARFGIGAREQFTDIDSRYLNDTRYIGRLAREYLSCICDQKEIDVVTGRLTATIRHELKINHLLDNTICNQLMEQYHVDTKYFHNRHRARLWTQAPKAKPFNIKCAISQQLIDEKDLFSQDVGILYLRSDPSTGELHTEFVCDASTADAQEKKQRMQWVDAYLCLFEAIEAANGDLLSRVKDQKSAGGKSRLDHRHHMVDAITIGLISESQINRARELIAEREEHLNGSDYELPIDKSTDNLQPWHGFHKSVQQRIDAVVVSHKKKLRPVIDTSKGGAKQTYGELHEETAVWVDKDVSEEAGDITKKSFTRARLFKAPGGYKVHYRKDGKEVTGGMKKTAKLVAISDATGKAFKAYKPGSNYLLEIFQNPKQGHSGEFEEKWHGYMLTTFEAHQQEKKICRHPAARMVLRLQLNDILELDCGEVNRRGLFRVQQLSEKQIALIGINSAEANRFREDRRLLVPESLRKLHPRKVHVSPAGRVSYEADRCWANGRE